MRESFWHLLAIIRPVPSVCRRRCGEYCRAGHLSPPTTDTTTSTATSTATASRRRRCSSGYRGQKGERRGGVLFFSLWHENSALRHLRRETEEENAAQEGGEERRGEERRGEERRHRLFFCCRVGVLFFSGGVGTGGVAVAVSPGVAGVPPLSRSLYGRLWWGSMWRCKRAARCPRLTVACGHPSSSQ